MTEYKSHRCATCTSCLHELAGLAEIARLPGFEEINAELVDQILEESAKFASGVLSPLNKPADEEGSKWRPRQGHHAQGLQGGIPASSSRPAGMRCRRPRSTAGRDFESRLDAGRRDVEVGRISRSRLVTI